MQYRVTIGLGQDSVQPAVLDDRASALQPALGQGSATVVVDPVKATLQLVLVVTADDALAAVQQALESAGSALAQARIGAPASIVTAEAEAVPVPGDDDSAVRPHPVSGDRAR